MRWSLAGNQARAGTVAPPLLGHRRRPDVPGALPAPPPIPQAQRPPRQRPAVPSRSLLPDQRRASISVRREEAAEQGAEGKPGLHLHLLRRVPEVAPAAAPPPHAGGHAPSSSSPPPRLSLSPPATPPPTPPPPSEHPPLLRAAAHLRDSLLCGLVALPPCRRRQRIAPWTGSWRRSGWVEFPEIWGRRQAG
ncbi:unnamed protein product [Urochloa humidicola]